MLDRFGQLDNSSHVVFKDIKLLTRGILSFTTLRRLIISNSKYAGGGGGSLIFSYKRRLGSFFGVQNFEFQYFWGVSEK